jgi:hypothetical protein
MANEDIPELEVPDSVQFPFDIAMVIDGTVFQVMNVTGQAAAQFLSQPTFVRITPENFAKVGWKYVDGVFAPPQNINYSDGL